MSVSRVDLADGKQLFTSLLRDVTESEAFEREQRTRPAVELANREKALALREIAHEIMGYLTTIQTTPDIWRRRFQDQLTDEELDFLSRMEIAARNIESVVTNLREVARIDRGGINLNYSKFSPRDLSKMYCKPWREIFRNARIESFWISTPYPPESKLMKADCASHHESFDERLQIYPPRRRNCRSRTG